MDPRPDRAPDLPVPRLVQLILRLTGTVAAAAFGRSLQGGDPPSDEKHARFGTSLLTRGGQAWCNLLDRASNRSFVLNVKNFCLTEVGAWKTMWCTAFEWYSNFAHHSREHEYVGLSKNTLHEKRTYGEVAGGASKNSRTPLWGTLAFLDLSARHGEIPGSELSFAVVR